LKRYLAFYGDIYYPGGGMNDYIGSYESYDDAIKAIDEKHLENRPDDVSWEWAWKQIFDVEKQLFLLNTFT